MAIHVTCPNCRFPYVLDEKQAGERFTCSACGTAFPLPAPASVELAAARLPPAEFTQRYQSVIGADTPLALVVMGVPSIRALQSPTATLLRSCWSFRHLVVLVGIITAFIICLTSDTLAQHGAPIFLGFSLLLLLAGYLVAVDKGALQYGDAARIGRSLFKKYLVNPFVLLVADARIALPAWRAFFLGTCLLGGSFLLAMRVGSWWAMLPPLPKPSAGHEETAKTAPAAPLPSSVTLFNDGSMSGEASKAPASTGPNPAAEEEHPAAPEAQGEAKPKTPARRVQRYTSPPPPPDQ